MAETLQKNEMINDALIINNALNPNSFNFKETMDAIKKDPWVEWKNDTKEGKKVFDYEDKNWCKWEIVIGKKGYDQYDIRVKKWQKIQETWQWDWKTQKYETSVIAKDKKEFNKKLWWILNETIWSKNRVNLKNTWTKVFEDLNNVSSDKKNIESEKKNQKEQWGEKTDLKKKPIDLQYSEKNKEKKTLANFPKNEMSVEGRITRCLRFASITDAVEDRYGIPRWLLMAMMAQEWRWDPTVINKRTNYEYVGKNKWNYVKEWWKYRMVGMWKWDYIIDEDKSCDWWAWLIHIQAANAIEYWLKTLPTYSDTSMVDYKHWEELEKARKKTGNNLAELSKLDDRFNPVLSVDVTARYLMEYCGWKNKSTWDERMKAVSKYAWRWMQDYWYSVLVYWSTINTIKWNAMPTFTKELEKVKSWKWAAKVNGERENVTNCITRTRTAIQNMNPTIDGKSVSLDEYYNQLELHRNNYWLDDYKEYNKGHTYVK